MAQITIYLDDDSLAKLNAATEDSNISKSQWIAEAIRQRIRREWPPAILALAGAWKDFPSAEEIRAQQGEDTARESF